MLFSLCAVCTSVSATFIGEEVKKTTPGIIIDNVKDALAVSADIIDSAEDDVAQHALGGVSLVVVGAVLFGSGVLFEMRANPNRHDEGDRGLKAAPRQTITS